MGRRGARLKTKKLFLLVLDGLGDRPFDGHSTPLAEAKTPVLAELARDGSTGLIDPITPGTPAGSDTSHLSLLGYEPRVTYTGRGPFEAMGLGMEIWPGDIAWRCNFGTVEESMMVTDRRAGRISEGTKELCDSLNGMEIDGVRVLVYPGVEHRAALVFRGPALSPAVSDVDPHEAGKKTQESWPMVREEAAARTARVLNHFVREAHKRLKSHEVNKQREAKGLPVANFLLPRGAGEVPRLQQLNERYEGFKAVCIAGIPLVRGICRLAGMQVPIVKGATGAKDSDLAAKARAMLDAIKTNDMVLMNVKAPDVCGHDGDWQGKKESIEKVDEMMRLIIDGLKGIECVVAVTGDHSTPIETREHSGDPVPLVIWGPGVRKDRTAKFDEFECMNGGLGRMNGISLMPMLMDLANRSVKYGA
ncbi:MAG TPA: 2,3-bisphosphoglycerate-independent phosphoglycerate mutase [Thermoplasmata archaeon]|nr:2,3-bisphosphoglycerate-independent phosphoglycerate mutase [Thermoplasmata archaeon]